MNDAPLASLTLPVYLDYCATTPVDPRVREKMMPYFGTVFGNASSRDHSCGWDAREAVEEARSAVAELIGASAPQIVFTSGATESVNLAIKGMAAAGRKRGNHIITTAVEHHAVLEVCRYLETVGCDVTYLPVDSCGKLDLEVLRQALRPETVLVAVMHANNETGVIFPVGEAASIVREHGALFFTDATQSVGKIPVSFTDTNIGFAALSAHKLYGPKGAGALYIRSESLRKSIVPLIHGGGQETGLRSGTLNVPAIVGFGEACRIAKNELEEDAKRCRVLRDHLEKELHRCFSSLKINGGESLRLPQVCNCSIPGISARDLIRKMGTIAVATASACSGGLSGTSHVLKAMGCDQSVIDGAIRLCAGKYTRREEIDYTIERIRNSV